MNKKEEKISKKTIIMTIIGITFMLVLIISSTYAYFMVNTENNTSETIITGKTEKAATASLNQNTEKLKLKLSANEMNLSNVGNYYADDENDYAPNKSLGYHDFATLTITNSNEDNNIYKCTFDVNIESNISNIKEGDMKVHFIIGNQVYDIDLIKLVNNSYKQEIEVELVGNSDKTLRGYIELQNKEENQNYLTNQKLNITISENNLKCELTGKEAVYLGSKNSYRNELYIDKIKNIEFVDYIASDYQNKIAYWDLTETSGERKSPAGSIIGWLEDSGDSEVPYNLYIGSEKEIYALTLHSAFLGMTKVENIQFNNFHTDLVSVMNNVFYECNNLQELDLSNFDTSKVITFSTMFYHSLKIQNIDVSQFDTTNTTRMDGMFQSMGSLSSLNLNNFNTRNVTNMTGMFENLRSLIELDLSNFDILNLSPNGMHNMFIYSSNLKTLNLSSFRTSQITDLYQTFHQNSSLEYLDIRNANFINVTDYEHAFDGIKNNVTIIVKDDANKKWVEDRLQEVGRTGNVIVAY